MPKASVVPMVATMAAIFFPAANVSRMAASSASMRMALSEPVGTATTLSCPIPSQAAAVRQL